MEESDHERQAKPSNCTQADLPQIGRLCILIPVGRKNLHDTNAHRDDPQAAASQALAKLLVRSNRWISEDEQELDLLVTILMYQDAYRKCTRHVERTLETELGGYLVGESFYDERTRKHYIIIEDILEAEHAKAGPTHFTFTHDSQVVLLGRLADEFPGKKCVGWYHSHPGLGVFLSSQDVFIHRYFFREPYQVALVIEPKSDNGGFFGWQQHGYGFPEGEHVEQYVGFYELLPGDQMESVVTWSNLQCQQPKAEVVEHKALETHYPISKELSEFQQQVAKLERDKDDLVRKLILQRATTILALFFLATLTFFLMRSGVTFQAILDRPTGTVIAKDQGTPQPVLSNTAAPTETPLPIDTSGADDSPEPTDMPGPTDTVVLEPTITPKPIDTASPEPTVTPRPTHTASPEPTVTHRPTHTASPEPTGTPKPTDVPRPKPTATSRSTSIPTPKPTPIGGLILVSEPVVLQDGQQLSPPYEVDSNRLLVFSFKVRNPGSQAVIVKNFGIGEYGKAGKFQSPDIATPYRIEPGEHEFQIPMSFDEPGEYEMFVQVRETEVREWLRLTLPSGEIPAGIRVYVR